MTHPVEVTVLMPVYNGQAYLREAIDSVLAQTLTGLELLVVDDGSVDDSPCIVQSYADPRLRMVRNERNLGIARTANRGLDLARGRYVAMLDQDDWAHPDRLYKQVAFLDENPDHAVVGSWTTRMDERGRPYGRVLRRAVCADEARAGLLFRCPVQHSSCMARTEVLRHYRYREGYPVAQDFELLMRVSERHKLASLPQVLTWGRRHAGQTTRRNAEQEREDYRRIFQAQLTGLGVQFEDRDLERHLLLRRSSGFSPGPAYLVWANDWLRRLKQANRRAERYPEPAFSRELRRKRLKLWRRALRSMGAGVVGGWIGSSAGPRARHR